MWTRTLCPSRQMAPRSSSRWSARRHSTRPTWCGWALHATRAGGSSNKQWCQGQSWQTLRWVAVVTHLPYLAIQLEDPVHGAVQVVGRLQLGKEVLQKILDLGVDPHDAPAAHVTISACGMTNAQGVAEAVLLSNLLHLRATTLCAYSTPDLHLGLILTLCRRPQQLFLHRPWHRHCRGRRRGSSGSATA